MMKFRREMGHNVPSTESWAHIIMPKSLEDPVVTVSTVWDDKSKTGETMVSVVKTRSYWDLEKDPGNIVAKHKDKRKAYDFQKEEVKRWQKS